MNNCATLIKWKQPIECSGCGKMTDSPRESGDKMYCPMCYLKEVEG